MAPKPKAALGLPLTALSPIDIGRLLRELASIDEYLTQLHLKSEDDKAKLPKTTELMDNLIEINKLNLLVASQRRHVLDFLKNTKADAPVLHISFGAEPSPAFLEKLVTWLRREIHPMVLVIVGLQPNIGAGCLVRSTNKYFDFSLRQNLDTNRDLLMSKLREVVTV